MTSVSSELGRWANELDPGEAGLELAPRALREAVGGRPAGRGRPATGLLAARPERSLCAVAGQRLDPPQARHYACRRLRRGHRYSHRQSASPLTAAEVMTRRGS
jgi:hypothetical protein